MQRAQRERVPSLPEKVKPLAAPVDDAIIEVFINETDKDRARYVTYREPPAGGSSSSRSAPPPAAPKPRASSASPLDRNKPRPTSGGPAPSAPAKRGEVPKYLQNRKAQLAAEKDLIRKQMEEMTKKKGPPGTVLLSEEEKAEAIRALEIRRKECEEALNRLPMRFDNLSIQKRRKELEDEIEEVEASIKKFSRKEVYVAV
eukprot:GGOE01002130.1.p2 GENE.GGOE01002130.1~~GGOE01002130.1.p2  ORF type:complete len:201 (+),score=58.86 GGOE01002130.1:86-688(+)